MLPPHFCLWQRKVDQLDKIKELGTYQIKNKNVWQKIKQDIYKKVDMAKIINIETMKQEIKDEKNE